MIELFANILYNRWQPFGVDDVKGTSCSAISCENEADSDPIHLFSSNSAALIHALETASKNKTKQQNVAQTTKCA